MNSMKTMGYSLIAFIIKVFQRIHRIHSWKRPRWRGFPLDVCDVFKGWVDTPLLEIDKVAYTDSPRVRCISSPLIGRDTHRLLNTFGNGCNACTLKDITTYRRSLDRVRIVLVDKADEHSADVFVCTDFIDDFMKLHENPL